MLPLLVLVIYVLHRQIVLAILVIQITPAEVLVLATQTTRHVHQ